jgi:hypothetical protein
MDALRLGNSRCVELPVVEVICTTQKGVSAGKGLLWVYPWLRPISVDVRVNIPRTQPWNAGQDHVYFRVR